MTTHDYFQKYSVVDFYDPLKDTQPGTFDLDLINHVVWAIVKHNSQFAVTSVSPGERIIGVALTNRDTLHLDCLGEPGAVNRIEASPDGTATFGHRRFDHSG